MMFLNVYHNTVLHRHLIFYPLGVLQFRLKISNTDHLRCFLYLSHLQDSTFTVGVENQVDLIDLTSDDAGPNVL